MTSRPSRSRASHIARARAIRARRTVDGANVHWTSKGSGPAVIFVHGWTCDESSWQRQVPRSASSTACITLDLPGHGKSDLPKDGTFSMELFARAVEAVRAEAKVDRAVFVGHSMGTPVIRTYALMYPAHVRRAGAGGRPRADRRGPSDSAAANGRPEGLKARENMVRGMFGPATTPQAPAAHLKMMLGTKEATRGCDDRDVGSVVGQERSDHRARARRVCGATAGVS
jgi:pimeloyl-ACP methyl ester carboxylesterase